MLSLRRDVGFDIPLLPFSVSRILPAVQILISSMGVQNSPALLPPRSVCPLPIYPSCRCRSQPLPGASRKQRYNTLYFPTENRVPTGMLLAPIGNPEPRGYSPLDTLHFRRQYIYKSAQPCIFHNLQKHKKTANFTQCEDEICGFFSALILVGKVIHEF